MSADIRGFQHALRIPDIMHSSQGTTWTGLEGLCLLLRRLCYPKRIEDMVPEFGRHPTEISIICNEMTYLLNTTWCQLLDTFRQPWLSVDNLRRFADTVFQKGCPLQSCFGFIDGVLKPCARPTYNQRNIYNGKDRVHGLKYQCHYAKWPDCQFIWAC